MVPDRPIVTIIGRQELIYIHLFSTMTLKNAFSQSNFELKTKKENNSNIYVLIMM